MSTHNMSQILLVRIRKHSGFLRRYCLKVSKTFPIPGLWGNSQQFQRFDSMAAHSIGFNYSNSLFTVCYKNDTSHAITDLFLYNFDFPHFVWLGGILIRDGDLNVLLMLGNKAPLWMDHPWSKKIYMLLNFHTL